MVSETRYFRQDKVLGTTNTIVLLSYGISPTLGIKVYKVSSGGVPTLLSGATPVAQANGLGTGEYDGTWNCPGFALDSTDHIRVEIYNFTTVWVLMDTWNSEDLGAQSLDAALWTVHYWFRYDARLDTWYFDTGTATKNSRITNFTWTAAPPPSTTREDVGDGLTFFTS